MSARGSVLISGASICGPALAHWLARYGFEPTVVERSDALRTAGQNIDVRGAGRQVLRRMDLEDEVRGTGTGEVGTRFVDEDGEAIAEFPAGTGDTDGATAELEILRGELSRLLVASAPAEYVFGDRIERLAQDDAGVTVGFAGGTERRFDVVVLAEGMRSRTRDLAFAHEPASARPEVKDLGLYTAYCVIPHVPEDDDWWRWYTATGGRSLTLRPDNLGTTRATFSFASPARGYEDLDPAGQRQVLRERFADAGWQAGRVLDALDVSSELYLEQIGQVKAPAWASGRVVLAGDAAHCASPVSGMGTSLALTGAYVLAGELAAHTHHRDAFRGYEQVMRPYVDQAQNLPPGVPGIAHPQTRSGLALLRAGLRVAASPPARSLGGRLFSPPADAIELPDYGHLERVTPTR